MHESTVPFDASQTTTHMEILISGTHTNREGGTPGYDLLRPSRTDESEERGGGLVWGAGID